MKSNQLTKGQESRVMYIENKDGLLGRTHARVGWVSFSKTGRTVYYQDRTLKATGGSGVRGNFRDVETGEEFWISGVKKRGSNLHPAESRRVIVDGDAKEEYQRIRRGA